MMNRGATKPEMKDRIPILWDGNEAERGGGECGLSITRPCIFKYAQYRKRRDFQVGAINILENRLSKQKDESTGEMINGVSRRTDL
jgi:hypothetical protein